MDICKWLKDTADQLPPDDPDKPRTPDFALPQSVDVGLRTQRYHRTRKRASSDSSLIIARRADRRAEWSPPPHPRQRSPDERDAKSSEYSSSQSARVEGKGKSYERRPRHKTRSDRYEPKQRRKRRRGRNEDEKGKPTRKRRKSNRTGDGDRTAGLVQSFQLKTVPRNNRLTLKPDHSVGLFKHGRAAPQMRGRGNGLPDLVFNEMRFLQKPMEHQDQPLAAESQQKRLKDGGTTQDEQISAYFRPVDGLLEGDRHGQMQRPRRNDQKSASQHKAAAMVELPEKPFLGFGSRGALPEVERVKDAGTECFTWSESVPGHVSQALQRQQTQPTQRIESEIMQHYSGSISRAAHTLVANDRNRVERVDMLSATERRVQPRAEKIAQPKPLQTHVTGNPLILRSESTAQSLPRLPRPQRQRVGGRSQERPADVLRGEYRTSDILDVQLPLPRPSHDEHVIPVRPEDDICSDKENADPKGSMDELLDQTREILFKPAFATLPAPYKRFQASSREVQKVLQPRTTEEIYPTSPERLAYPTGPGQVTHLYLMPETKHWIGKSTQSFAQHPYATPVMFRDSTLPWFPGDHPIQADAEDEHLAHEDEDVLDTAPLVIGGGQHFGDEDVGGFEGLARIENSSLSAGRMSIQGLPIQPDFMDADSLGMAKEEVDGFEGFWKPNMLY